MSVYILAASSADDIRRFAEEVAPAVRELVADGRAAAAGAARAGARGDARPRRPRRSPSRRPRTTGSG